MKWSVIAVAALSASAAFAAQPIAKYASPLKDIRVKSFVQSRDMDALKKISNEFAQSYRIANSEMYYKEPAKLKIISKAGLVDVVYTINGNEKTVKAGFINKKMDISHSPGQRQSVISVGLLTPSWLDLVDVTSLGSGKVDGRDVAIYETHFKEEPKGAYSKLFIDEARKFVVRQEQYHGDGRPKMTLRFLSPISLKGVWIPTVTEVYNGEGKRGAVTKMQIVSVNAGLSDSLFTL